MDGRIGSLHCEYLGDDAAVRALDQVARTTLPAALDTALTALAGIGDAVYVCREVRSDCVLDPHAPDLARRWAEEIAGSVSRAIADDRHDHVNVVRFADQADYTARYLADHVHGRAVDRWYYRPLARSGHRPSDVAVFDAIRGPSAGAVLAALHRQGTLPDVLSVLEDGALAAVAGQVLLPTEQTPATGDPLLTTAIQIASHCSLWTGGVVVPEDIVAKVADWRSPVALAEAVVAVLGQLGHRGLLRRGGVVLPDEVRAGFGWLDLRLVDRWLSVVDVPVSPGAVDLPEAVVSVGGQLGYRGLLLRDGVVLRDEARAELDWLSLAGIDQWLSVQDLPLTPGAMNLPGWSAEMRRLTFQAAVVGWRPVAVEQRGFAELGRWLSGFAGPSAVTGWPLGRAGEGSFARFVAALNLAFPGEATWPSRRLSPMSLGIDDTAGGTRPAVTDPLWHTSMRPKQVLPDHEMSTVVDRWLVRAAASLGGTPVLLGFGTALALSDRDTRSLGDGPAVSAGPGFLLLDTGSVVRARERVLAEWRIAMAHRLGGVPVDLGRITTSTPAPVAGSPTGAELMRHSPADLGKRLELGGTPAAAIPVGSPPRIGTGELGGNPALTAQVRMAVHQLLTAAPGAVDLGQRIGAAGPGPYSTVLLTAALFAEHPEWTDEPAVSQVITEAMAAWRDPDRVTEFGDLARVLAMTAVSTPEEIVTSPNAGMLLLLRSVADLRLPALLTRSGFATGLPATLLTVAARLTGADPSDPAAHVFAGLPEQPPDVLLSVWRQADDDRCARVRDEVTSAARAQRITLDGDSAAELPDGLLGVPSADATIGLVSVAVLRAWSRWLGQFAGSSPGYLAGHFLCRAGTVHLTEDEIVVELTGGPLDVVLQLAGYDAPIATVPWLGGRSVTYRIGAR